MGLFSKIKKAFKKITSKVKKVVKKVVKGVKKVVKKIGSSKILKAIAIAGAAIVTGGAALGAFGSGAGLSATKFGTWMMGTSQKALAGNLFGGSGVLSKIGNFAVQTASKPFGAVGGALGSTARIGANILTGQSAFAAGPAAGAPVPFSGAALSGQMDTSRISYSGTTADGVNQYRDNVTGKLLTESEISRLPDSFIKQTEDLLNAMDKNLGKFDGSSYKEVKPGEFEFYNPEGEVIDTLNTNSTKFLDTRAGQFVSNVGTRVATNVFTGAAMQSIVGEPDPTGVERGPGGQERAGAFDPLRIYAAENNINVSDIYNQALYGNVDPSSIYGSQLYSQETVGVA
jgi:hypothetical protein